MPFHADIEKAFIKPVGRKRFRQKPRADDETDYPQYGGLYVISTWESQFSPWIVSSQASKGPPVFKIGLSKKGVLGRIDGYYNTLPEGVWIHFLVRMPNETDADKKRIEEAEKWVFRYLDQRGLRYRPHHDVRTTRPLEWFYNLQQIKEALVALSRDLEFKKYVKIFIDNDVGVKMPKNPPRGYPP